MTATSLIEQLAEDLRKSFVSVTYWVTYGDKPRTLARYTDFVGNCAFFGLEGISSPHLVIRQHKGRTRKPNLKVPLKNILAIEIDEGRTGTQVAWWYAPFGGELRRFLP